MSYDKMFAMQFEKVYQLLIAKAVKKGRTLDEVNTITCWLTGYQIEQIMTYSGTYGDFFKEAPNLNENRKMITGKICGILVEEISDPLIQNVRYLDKLIDELASGKPLEKILRKAS